MGDIVAIEWFENPVLSTLLVDLRCPGALVVWWLCG